MDNPIIPAHRIAEPILLVRGQKVILDLNLSRLYEVERRALKLQVKRTIDRVPKDFIGLFPITFGAFEHSKKQPNPRKKVDKGIYGTGHNSIIQKNGTDEWYSAYHRFNRPNGINRGDAAGFGPEVCIDRLEFQRKFCQQFQE